MAPLPPYSNKGANIHTLIDIHAPLSVDPVMGPANALHNFVIKHQTQPDSTVFRLVYAGMVQQGDKIGYPEISMRTLREVFNVNLLVNP